MLEWLERLRRNLSEFRHRTSHQIFKNLLKSIHKCFIFSLKMSVVSCSCLSPSNWKPQNFPEVQLKFIHQATHRASQGHMFSHYPRRMFGSIAKTIPQYSTTLKGDFNRKLHAELSMEWYSQALFGVCILQKMVIMWRVFLHNISFSHHLVLGKWNKSRTYTL